MPRSYVYNKIRRHMLISETNLQPVTPRPPVEDKYIVTTNKLCLSYHNVNKKNAAITMDAILLAFVLNPQAMKQAPINEEPRYPAGRVIQDTPPDIRVSPPSSAEKRFRSEEKVVPSTLTVERDRVDVCAG